MNKLESFDLELVLDRINLQNQARISKWMLGEWLRNPRIEAYIDDNMEALVVELRGYVWGKREQVKVIKYPCDWWEAFRGRWFPKFLLKKWPVKMTEHRIEAIAMFPSLKYEMGGYEMKVVLKDHIGESWWGR